ncbi:tetratricopeptide repeat protein [Thiohalocapsa marina]|uniref:Tetratricopeptide repeat protein n=1 Tax=Thiohalocapsa marina TaxID=424902 RepID=A0A5M8FQJ9_9GAMM|nr:tetratricopeptide repeat protein [Thiohalocapsa marina]KAA6183232.1 tetratricopeptide repeat protein [Thiohalocapsa marina]
MSTPRLGAFFTALLLTAPAQSGAPVSAEPAATAPDELNAELVYDVLVGEVALQRGAHHAAFRHYLSAATQARDPGLAELAAAAALGADDADAALQATRLWIELEPLATKARQIRAYAQLDRGDRSGALDELRRLLDLLPDPAHRYMQVAQLLTRVAEPAERLSMMRELLAGRDDDADAQQALAMLAAAADQPDAARAYAERAALLRPDWNDPRMFQVRLLATEQRRDDALALLQQYLAADPDDQELRLMLAQFHVDAERYAEALTEFSRVLEADPAQPDVLLAAAVLAAELDALAQARDYLNRLHAFAGRADDAAYLLGQVEEQAENPQQAMDWYRQVRGENLSSAQIRLAGLHAQQGEVKRAREILQRLRDQSPADAITLYLIEGDLLSEHGLDEQAIAVYGDALKAHPENADLLYGRAMLAVGMDRVDLLERDLRRILVADPDHVDALNALGYTLADRTDRLDEALSLVERALQLSPDEPAILDSMGWVRYRMGDATGAEPYLRKALDSVFDAEIAAHLGEVLWTLDRRDEARAIWERALSEYPTHEYLLKVLGRHRFTQSEP